MKTCQRCGQPMSDTAEGLCPRCLMSAAVKTDAPEPVTRLTPAPDFPNIADMAEVARRLPQFEFISLLGRGGMGVVYKARQVQLDRVVALKILPPAEALSPDFIERFRREARSLAKLSHPNIVTIHDFGETGGLYYFVMEFIDGVNLREMIRSGKMKPAEALAVVPKICDALQFAHEEGVVHRDIKPENILIDKRGRVKIADFGLAKLLRRDATDHTLTQIGMTLGTPRYMAPEQLDKPESVDHRADIYSLGVVFYEMLTGEVPIGRFALPSEKVQVDVKLDEIVLRSLERDVERRYQHASEVKTDVENVTQASPPVPSTAPPAVTASPLAGPRLSRFALAGAIWALLGVVAVIPGMLFTYLASYAEGKPSGPIYETPPAAFLAFMGVLLFIGAGAPIGTTIFGAIAIGHIRRSGGKLYGLPLAFADAVFFPLLLLAVLVFLGTGMVWSASFDEPGHVSRAPIPAIIAALIITFFAARFAWRRVAGVTATPAAPSRPLDHRISEAVTVGFPGWFHRRARWMQALVQTALVIVMAIGWFALLGYRMQRKTEVVEGGAMVSSGTLELGQPWPWMTVKGGPLSHGVFMHWDSPALWLALLAAAAHGVSEMLRRTRPGFDAAADRRKQRIGWSIAAFFILLWLVVTTFMAKSVMSIHGTPTPGALARATGGEVVEAGKTKPPATPVPSPIER